MRKLARYTEVLAVVETAMPDASLEEKFQTSFEIWRFFPAYPVDCQSCYGVSPLATIKRLVSWR